jgi:hypothetical protein
MKNFMWILLILVCSVALGFSALNIYGTVTTADAAQADAYDNQYQIAYQQYYDSSFQEMYDGSYSTAYDSRYTAGYNEQYQTSYDEQYEQSYDAEYETGYREKYTEGYDSEYQDNYDLSYAEGSDAGYKAGYASGKADGLKANVSLHDPTYRELLDFIARDPTDKEKYDATDFNCVDFSAMLDNNAEKAGIRAAFVMITYPQEPGHAIVAFQTTDKGLIYIEPQFDVLVKLEVGKRYYKCIVPPEGYYYTAPPYNDTVEEIEVVW